MKNEKNVIEFTQRICQLIKSGLSVETSLTEVSVMKSCGKKICYAANEIKESMEGGASVAVAFMGCSSIHFNEKYIAFLSAAEKSGSLKKTFEFLLEDFNRESKVKQKLIGFSIYPLFVLAAAVCGSIALVVFSEKIICDFTDSFDCVVFRKKAISTCLLLNLFLFIFVVYAIWKLKRIFNQDELKIFTIIEFILDGGGTLYEALKVSLLAADRNRKLCSKISDAMENLEEGLSVSESLSVFGIQYYGFLESAECTGLIKDAFKQIVESLNERRNQNERLLDNLLEPVIVIVLAVYLMILTVKLVLPVMFSYQF